MISNVVNKKERVRIIKSIILLLAAIVWVFYSLYLDLQIHETENKGLLFQRSGSILVLFSSMIEYFLEKENIKTVIFSKINFLMVLIGTFIWGYGDLMFTDGLFTKYFIYLIILAFIFIFYGIYYNNDTKFE